MQRHDQHFLHMELPTHKINWGDSILHCKGIGYINVYTPRDISAKAITFKLSGGNRNEIMLWGHGRGRPSRVPPCMKIYDVDQANIWQFVWHRPKCIVYFVEHEYSIETYSQKLMKKVFYCIKIELIHFIGYFW